MVIRKDSGWRTARRARGRWRPAASVKGDGCTDAAPHLVDVAARTSTPGKAGTIAVKPSGWAGSSRSSPWLLHELYALSAGGVARVQSAAAIHLQVWRGFRTRTRARPPAAGGPQVSEYRAHDLGFLCSKGMASTHALDGVNVVAGQATVSMVSTERVRVARLDDTVDHPIRDPVGERLDAMTVHNAAQGLPLNLLLDRLRDGCQWMAVNVRRHGRTSMRSPSEHPQVIPLFDECGAASSTARARRRE